MGLYTDPDYWTVPAGWPPGWRVLRREEVLAALDAELLPSLPAVRERVLARLGLTDGEG